MNNLAQVSSDMADKLTAVCCDAVEAILSHGEELDLHMVEVMEMKVGRLRFDCNIFWGTTTSF